MDEVYEPQEDSYLLQKYVKEYAKGIVLDVGTGSGIQAATAAKRADFVIAIDINDKALQHCAAHVHSDRILFMKSDLFSVFEKREIFVKGSLFKGIGDRKEGNKFDLIIFNAPYLPEDSRDKDIALDGGKEGHEIIERFLSSAAEYLAPEGKLLLIFSSQTGKEEVDSLIEKNGFGFKELEKIHIFFEDIFCYLIERKSPR